MLFDTSPGFVNCMILNIGSSGYHFSDIKSSRAKLTFTASTYVQVVSLKLPCVITRYYIFLYRSDYIFHFYNGLQFPLCLECTLLSSPFQVLFASLWTVRLSSFTALCSVFAADCPIMFIFKQFTLTVSSYVVVEHAVRGFQQFIRFILLEGSVVYHQTYCPDSALDYPGALKHPPVLSYRNRLYLHLSRGVSYFEIHLNPTGRDPIVVERYAYLASQLYVAYSLLIA